MISIDAIRLLSGPSRLRVVASLLVGVLGAAAIPAAVMAFGPSGIPDRVIGHVSVTIPAAEPYHDVPPPDPVRRGEIIQVEK